MFGSLKFSFQEKLQIVKYIFEIQQQLKSWHHLNYFLSSNIALIATTFIFIAFFGIFKHIIFEYLRKCEPSCGKLNTYFRQGFLRTELLSHDGEQLIWSWICSTTNSFNYFLSSSVGHLANIANES